MSVLLRLYPRNRFKAHPGPSRMSGSPGRTGRQRLDPRALLYAPFTRARRLPWLVPAPSPFGRGSNSRPLCGEFMGFWRIGREAGEPGVNARLAGPLSPGGVWTAVRRRGALCLFVRDSDSVRAGLSGGRLPNGPEMKKRPRGCSPGAFAEKKALRRPGPSLLCRHAQSRL